MNYEKLVDFLVDEIYKKIQNEKEFNKKENKKKIIVMGEKNIDSYKETLKEFNVEPFDENSKECDILIVSKLCIKGLSTLAQGNCTTKNESFLLRTLLNGKKVYLLSDGIEYRKYKNTAPKVLYNKYIKFEEELQSFGVEIIDNINSILNENKINLKEEKVNEIKENLEDLDEKSTINLSGKRVISESDLKKPVINGLRNIIIGKKSIITPLAKDYIRINNLNVIFS